VAVIATLEVGVGEITGSSFSSVTHEQQLENNFDFLGIVLSGSDLSKTFILAIRLS
jgi:hypothetical protein